MTNKRTISLIANSYMGFTNATDAYLSANGVKFLHFFQPVPQEKKLSDIEIGYIDDLESRKGVNYSAGVQEFNKSVTALIREGLLKSADLSDLWRTTSEQRFIDSVHYNSVGNREIATRVCERVAKL